jgi:CRISPR-associated protein Cas1
LVMCGRDHFPRAISLPVSGNFEQAARLSGQASLPLPKRKQFWRRVVQAKISSQARTLEYAGHRDHAALKKMVKSVRSGDPENVEARAARYYWRRLLGEEFRRDVAAEGLNSHLNYGYTVVRAAMARAVVGAGLAPGLGLHHRSRLNAFQLVDDLMEPFRCLVDQCVWRNRGNWTAGVMADAKAELADVINFSMPTRPGSGSVSRTMSALALSLAEICTGTKNELEFPQDWIGQDQREFDLD